MRTGAPNFLQQRLEELLTASPEGVSEHALIRRLANEGRSPFADASLLDELQLFRVHFVLFHLLYSLRDRLREEKRGDLRISPLNIALTPYSPGCAGLAESDPLCDYYLDPENLGATREDVRRLLASFHERVAAVDAREEALALLGLEGTADYGTVKSRYRKLAMRHHPDRGGDTGTLQRLNRAMAVLERCYK